MASYDKFADDTAAKLKKLGGKSKSDEGKDDDTEVEVTVSAKKKPGALGKLLIAAVRKGDGEAVEEAVRSMCESYEQPEENDKSDDDNE